MVTPATQEQAQGQQQGAAGTQATPVAPMPHGPKQPAHTQTQSTLAPTSEFVRYLLLALPARYTFRAVIDGAFNARAPKIVKDGLDAVLTRVTKKPAAAHDRDFSKSIAYDYALGVGSLALSTTYTRLVYRDIQNMFRETVGMELGKDPQKVTFWDLSRSKNKIVETTLHNFRQKTAERFGTDLLFFARPVKWLRWMEIGDLMIGVKAALAFGDTWKRKTTMFEDLITFVNNKINPRNGLGQPITVGEVFDLYQHYMQVYAPERMFTNVLEQGTGEGALWAESQPIFQRLTELMNNTYAYKHTSVIDPDTGRAVHQANFTLPKFIHLLGHDLIDVHQSQQTLVTIEVANRYGIEAVKEMTASLKQGKPLAEVLERYPVTVQKPQPQKVNDDTNGVIAKGSSMQVDAIPGATVSSVALAGRGAEVPLDRLVSTAQL